MYDYHIHSVSDRIVSVSQPFVRPIVRGKAGKPVEFCMKLDISVVDGWTRLEYHSFDAYNESKNLQEMAERFYQRKGHYPARILADKIYRNRESLNYCKAHGIRLSGPALGRPKRERPEIEHKTIKMNVSAWRQNAQVQYGKAQMWHRTGYCKTARDSGPCNCHVRSGAESA